MTDLILGKRGCHGTNRLGRPCDAQVIGGSDYCLRHSMTDEEWHEQARRGGRKRQEEARAQDLRRDLDDYIEGKHVLENFLRITDAWLDAKIPGSGEPNFELVGLALVALARTFKLGTKEEVLELLREIRPDLVREPRVHAFLDVEGARARLLAAYREGRIEAEDLPVGVLTT